MKKESGKIVGDTACPKCRENGRDATGNHLMLFDDGGSYCNRCGYTGGKENAKDNMGSQPMLPNKTEDDVGRGGGASGFNSIRTLPHSPDVSRGISLGTSTYFGVRYGFDESTGLHDSTYYPIAFEGNCVAYKQRVLPKGFFIKSDRKMKGVPVEFFGQSQCNKACKKLLITGGEEDAMAAYEMLLDRYPKFKPAVVSVTHGENLSCVADNKEFLDNYQEILVCTDMDEAGRKVAEQICKQIGERCKLVLFDEKDASDMKVKGKANEFVNAYFNAKDYRPSSIVLIEDIIDEIIAPVPWGLSYPFESLTNLSYGLKEGGEIIGIGAGPGAGKSTLMHMIQAWIIFTHGERIALFDIEEGAVRAAKHLVGGIINKPIHKPDCIYDQGEARMAAESIAGKVEFFDGHPEWEEVRDNIRYFASKGIRFFFLDPISALVAHLSASEGNEVLGRVMKDLMKFRKELGLTFFHVNHLNNPPGGKDHGAGAQVYGSQFSGSRAMWKYSTMLLGLQRNQLAETEEEKNTSTLTVIKDRLGGNTGSFQLIYNRESGKMEEVERFENEF